MTTNAQWMGLALALAAGLLIGVERGWRQRAVPEGHRPAGVRTFGLIGLLGGMAALLGERWGVGVLIVAWAALAIALLAGYVATVLMHRAMGLTTLVAALTTFAIGALAGGGAFALAAAAAVVTVLLLQLKTPLHGSIAKLEAGELTAAFQLLLISVVILPVLPDRGFGPYAALNPYQLWWAVVLIAALSFAGYVAMRATGARRGLLITAILGGIASSTATTATMARFAKAEPALTRAAVAGATLACAAMFARLLVLVALVAPAVAPRLAPVLAGMAGAGLLLGAWWQRTVRDAAMPEPTLHNPLDLSLALRFGAFLALVALLSAALTARFGSAGLIATSALAGLADVDAITVTIGRLAGEGGVSESIAAWAVLIAAGVNQLTKLVLAATLAGRAMLGPLALAYAAMAAVGVAVAAVLR